MEENVSNAFVVKFLKRNILYLSVNCRLEYIDTNCFQTTFKNLKQCVWNFKCYMDGLYLISVCRPTYAICFALY